MECRNTRPSDPVDCRREFGVQCWQQGLSAHAKCCAERTSRDAKCVLIASGVRCPLSACRKMATWQSVFLDMLLSHDVADWRTGPDRWLESRCRKFFLGPLSHQSTANRSVGVLLSLGERVLCSVQGATTKKGLNASGLGCPPVRLPVTTVMLTVSIARRHFLPMKYVCMYGWRHSGEWQPDKPACQAAALRQPFESR